MLDHNLVLKSDELYVVGNISTDGSGERATGLYLRDTRHLSRFRVTLNGQALTRLAARVHDPTHATVTSANGATTMADGSVVMPHTVVVEEAVRLDTSLHVTFRMTNYGIRTLPLALGCEFASDFRDLFDIRGMGRPKRGRVTRARIDSHEIVMGYRDLAGEPILTTILFDREPAFGVSRAPVMDHLQPVPMLPGYDELSYEPDPHDLPVISTTFLLDLEPGVDWVMHVEVIPQPAGNRPVSGIPNVAGITHEERVVVESDNAFFDRVIDRGQRDLTELQTTFDQGTLPAAGIPWYVAPFGRDSLVTGLQTLHMNPDRAIGILRVLGALQGVVVDTVRHEEPGKILHEVRYGEMARLREIPHTPYFATVDATPLFGMLFAETVAWTGDESLYRELKPNVMRALEWCRTYGDPDGDGLIEYASVSSGTNHMIHQGWKDSHDSLHHVDGRPSHGSIALIEPQGYTVAAFSGVARVARCFGDPEWADELDAHAERVRLAIDEHFWNPDEGYFAQALDGDKTQVRAISSNPGHLLMCDAVMEERLDDMVIRLAQSDLHTGWGVRTLSTRMPTYNPMSYHNGSIWPHDNSLIAAGLYRHRFFGFANEITGAMFAAANADPTGRLPELFCGFGRSQRGQDAPVPYPVSCSPQAWAAGTMPLLLRGMLGMEPDPAQRCITLRPALPGWLNRIHLRNLSAFGERFDLMVERVGDGHAITTTGPVHCIEERQRETVQ